MRFLSPLVRATLARRYKRFLCDAVLASGERVTAHCPNPGAMLGVAEPGSEIWLQPAATEARRLAYTWELIRVGRGLVGINAQNPNTIVAEALAQRRIDALAGYDHIQREVRVGDASRLDFRLTAAARPECYVEVKNVHLSRVHGLAEFPDSVTDRGRKHLGVLAQAAHAGKRAVMLYLVQRTDCVRFALAADIDPAYAAALGAAVSRGVEVLCYACRISPRAIVLGRALPSG
ncbi:MAG: DNA/RNA nuclease SfsA [Alphaproteobacteria bacterium]|nr:DNA/RNA nuclease SfsA [Alphaproteobacteria bacterium]